MNEQPQLLSQIRLLTQEERQLAYAAAQETVNRAVGEHPQRDLFNQ
ncbi:MAG: hypothetical protein KJ065_10950 [Anaerolineae bacterium]|nr:hypothetical protein [Anaerolineae bacterium]